MSRLAELSVEQRLQELVWESRSRGCVVMSADGHELDVVLPGFVSVNLTQLVSFGKRELRLRRCLPKIFPD